MLLLAAAAESISVDHIQASSGWLAPGTRQQHKLSKVHETLVDLRAGAGKTYLSLHDLLPHIITVLILLQPRRDRRVARKPSPLPRRKKSQSQRRRSAPAASLI
jgi:hypothetical protein